MEVQLAATNKILFIMHEMYNLLLVITYNRYIGMSADVSLSLPSKKQLRIQ